MWHEARKQEKKIREAVVDLKKRAERRRQHYAKQVGQPLFVCVRVYSVCVCMCRVSCVCVCVCREGIQCSC